MEYHDSLLRGFSNFVSRLEDIFDERVRLIKSLIIFGYSLNVYCLCLFSSLFG